MKSSTLYLVGIVSVFFVALYFGLAGVDFGPQWDQKTITGFVRQYVRTGVILPGEYHYPPVSSYIASTTLVPYAAPFIVRYGANWIPTQRYLMEEVLNSNNQSFLLNVRSTFVVFSMLGIVWTGLAAFQRNKIAGLVAAAALAFSWELSYHSRLVHPDGPTMQFVALSLLFCMLAYYRRKPFDPRVWLGLAAFAAAVATATKYTAGVSIFVVLIFAYAVLRREKGVSSRKTILWLIAVLLIFAATFLLLVPGVILESDIFIQQVTRDQEIYATGHGYQTINAGWDYLQAVFLYLFQAAFSYDRVLALFIPVFAMLGIYSIVKEPKRPDLSLVLALAGVPLLYILFLATHRVFIVRNLLFILPGIAILAGFGFSWLLERLQAYSPTWRYALVGALVFGFGANAAWLNHTVQTIRTHEGGVFTDEALTWISDHPDENVYVTPAALLLLGGRDLPRNADLRLNGDEDLVLFAYRSDTIDESEGSWPVNAPDASPLVFGQQEINMDWYANWPGVERFVLSTPDLAWRDGARLLQRIAAQPSAATVETSSGNLSLDGEQFFVEVDAETRINILNSANPNVILALRPLVDTQITMTGMPEGVEGPAAWFLLTVNGHEVLGIEAFSYEYNTSRFLLNLSDAQKACIEKAVGGGQFRNLGDTTIGLIDLTDEDLQRITVCLD